MVCRVHYKRRGAHVHARVFTARRVDLTFANHGTLIFGADEWADVRDLLFRHAEVIDDDRRPELATAGPN